MESAISIFLAGLRRIYKSGASHIFATHLHEVVNNSEIKEMEHTKLMHMTVRYDNEKQDLVYDRKLKPGSGVSCYGLEVCKSLYLDNDFMDDAYNNIDEIFIENAIQKKAIVIDGDGSDKLDFTYINDLMEGVYRAIISQNSKL